MREILTYIRERKAEYACLPFFDFLRNSNIEARQRLAFAPCFAFFVMGFGELNKHAFRQEPTSDSIQAIINQHTYEDDSHWVWFLEDLEKLNIDYSSSFSNTLKFLWSQENDLSRWTTYQLYRLTFEAMPIQKLIVIEAIEATAEIFLDLTSQVACELQASSQKEYKYFGQHHFNLDTHHTMHSERSEHQIEEIVVPDEFVDRAYELVDEVFAIFTRFSNSLLSYSLAKQAERELDKLSVVPELTLLCRSKLPAQV